MIQTAKRLKTVEEYYFSIKLREVRQLIEQGKPIINMGIGSPDLDPPLSVTRALSETLSQKGVHKYQSYKGRPELRSTISSFYGKWYNVALNSDTEVLPMMGSKEAIMHISMAFLNKGDEVLIPNPGYPTYTAVSKIVEAIPRFYNLSAHTSWLPDLVALEKESLVKVKLMWVNYPHMPTGAPADKNELEKIVRFAKRNNILVVNDNPYSFILNEQPTSILEIEGAKEIAIELNSLSKTFNMAGWRVGMAASNESFINSILKIKSNMDSGMFYGIQEGAIAALNMGQDWFTKLNQIYHERRELICKIADKLNCSYDSNTSGMFIWAKLPKGSEDDMAFTDKLLYKHDIFVTPGSIFGTQGKGYIRFSLCIDKDSIQEALARL